MGSTQHKQTKQEEGPFGVKEMVRKSQVLDPAAHYEFLELLGEGNYAKVFKARGVATGEFRVVKKVEKAKCPTMGRHLMNEYAILKEMVRMWRRRTIPTSSRCMKCSRTATTTTL